MTLTKLKAQVLGHKAHEELKQKVKGILCESRGSEGVYARTRGIEERAQTRPKVAG
ncbi:MAG: hypothetical protein ACP5GS_05400 [Nitrososphaeria archaeon]